MNWAELLMRPVTVRFQGQICTKGCFTYHLGDFHTRTDMAACELLALGPAAPTLVGVSCAPVPFRAGLTVGL